MQRIDIFDFLEMFRSVRSIALVGNSSSILQWNNGAIIDSYDMVVRFNRAYTTGLEHQIGGKTDVLVANMLNSLDKAPSPADTLKPSCVLCFVTPRRLPNRIELFRAWVGDLPFLLTFSPDLVGLDPGPRDRRLTLGTYTLYTLLQLLPVEKLFLTGFTMYGAAPGGAEKYYHDPNSLYGNQHNCFHEAWLFAQILSRFQGDLHLTPEVQALLDRHPSSSAPRMSSVAGGASKVPLLPRMLSSVAGKVITFGMRIRSLAEKSLIPRSNSSFSV